MNRWMYDWAIMDVRDIECACMEVYVLKNRLKCSSVQRISRKKGNQLFENSRSIGRERLDKNKGEKIWRNISKQI